MTDAIKDENVLKFAVEYVGRYKKKPGAATEVDIEVEAIDTKELMESPAWLEKITDYIIERHAVKTRNKEFTAMMCVGSVDTLIKYYELFAAKKKEGKHKLRIATIFSYTANEEDKDADGILDDDSEIPDCFEDFLEKERVAAFEQLVKEEQLDPEKLKKVIDRYVYTGEKPLPDPDIVELIQKPMSVLERGPARKRVLEKVVDYVTTFIQGVAA